MKSINELQNYINKLVENNKDLKLVKKKINLEKIQFLKVKNIE